MKTTITTVLCLLASFAANCQDIYSKAFGNKKDNVIIFLHGGPGYNCANFEATTAQPLADKGFYVIVYDRRGEGRSKDPNAKFTFKESTDDLIALYKKYHIKKASLIGHSFGGVLASAFASSNAKKVESVILVGAPVSLQATFKHIIEQCKLIYQSRKDSVSLNYLNMLEKLDTASLQYSSYCFQHAMRNGFYSPKNPTAEAMAIYSRFATDSTLRTYASQMTFEAPQGFWKHEAYTIIDISKQLQTMQQRHVKLYALYGKDDGLYSQAQVSSLQQLIGSNNLRYLDNCSHNVFIDQQNQFLESVSNWIH